MVNVTRCLKEVVTVMASLASSKCFLCSLPVPEGPSQQLEVAAALDDPHC